jgi:hypothetical protein
MIPPALIEEIRRLLDEGQLSQRMIARTVGVSRGTVNAIATGRRLDAPAHPFASGEDTDFTPPAGLHVRCPGCGSLTQMPCLACYIRARSEAVTPARADRCRRPIRETIAAASRG